MVTMTEHMQQTCNGGLQYGSRYFHNDGKHGSLSLAEAIAKSCNTYFYQLGIKVGLTKLLAGGVNFGFKDRAGIDLPEERAPLWPATTSYFDRRYGKSSWTSSVVLNLAIGHGENAQTILNMRASTPLSPTARNSIFRGSWASHRQTTPRVRALPGRDNGHPGVQDHRVVPARDAQGGHRPMLMGRRVRPRGAREAACSGTAATR